MSRLSHAQTASRLVHDPIIELDDVGAVSWPLVWACLIMSMASGIRWTRVAARIILGTASFLGRMSRQSSRFSAPSMMESLSGVSLSPTMRPQVRSRHA